MKYLLIILLIGIICIYLIFRKITKALSKINIFFNESKVSNNIDNRKKYTTNNEIIYKDDKVEVLVGEAKRKK